MSALVRITAPGHADRIVTLPSGAHKMGAALSCEFLLLDQGIADEHFSLFVADDRITVTLLPEATATLNGTAMVPGVEIVLKLGMKIEVGDVALTFRGGAIDDDAGLNVFDSDGDDDASGDMPAIAGSKVNMLPLVATPSVRAAGLVAVAACLVAVVWIGLDDGVSNSMSAESMNSANMGQMDMTAGIASRSKPVDRFMSDLATADMKPGSPEPEMAAMLSETALRASEIVLAGIDRKAKAIQVKGGILQVSGIRPDDPKVEDMRRALLADIPALEEVTFSQNPRDQIAALKDQVAGVWAGKRPYVVRVDGEVIKPSQELHDGIILTAVFDKHIEVTIGADQHTVVLQ